MLLRVPVSIVWYFAVLAFPLMNLANTPLEPKAGVSMGFNLPHVFEGQVYSGPGIYAGIFSQVKFSRSWGLRLDIGYSQNSNFIEPFRFPSTVSNIKTRFNYVEIPILAHFEPKQRSSKLKVAFLVGPAFASLINYKVKIKNGNDISSQVEMARNRIIVPQIALTIKRKHFGLLSKASLPISRQQGVTFSGQIFYQF